MRRCEGALRQADDMRLAAIFRWSSMCLASSTAMALAVHRPAFRDVGPRASHGTVSRCSGAGARRSGPAAPNSASRRYTHGRTGSACRCPLPRNRASRHQASMRVRHGPRFSSHSPSLRGRPGKESLTGDLSGTRVVIGDWPTARCSLPPPASPVWREVKSAKRRNHRSNRSSTEDLVVGGVGEGQPVRNAPGRRRTAVAQDGQQVLLVGRPPETSVDGAGRRRDAHIGGSRRRC